MQELEKILEEIQELRGKAGSECTSEDHYIKKAWELCLDQVTEIIRNHMNDGWVSVEERLPEDNKYILLSFENFSLPLVGRYDEDTEGGAFYLGDCDDEDTCISMDLLVNAWMPLAEPYRPGRSEGE